MLLEAMAHGCVPIVYDYSPVFHHIIILLLHPSNKIKMSREDCNILISVIIPCHNSAQTLKDTVECLHKELSKATEDCFEILIINDGSTDTTEDIAVELASSTIRIINKQQGGVSSARNRGLYI